MLLNFSRFKIASLMGFIHFLSFLNYNKRIEGDLIQYQVWFDLVDKFSFFDFLFLEGKEPVYFSFVYLIKSLGADFPLFIYLISFTAYLLIAISILHFLRNHHKNLTIVSLLVLFLFPELFSLSAHLVRQFLAFSVFSLVLSGLIKNKKLEIVVFLVSGMIHTSIFLFVPVLLLYRKKEEKGSFFISLGAFFLILFLVKYFSQYFIFLQEFPLFGYIFERFFSKNNWSPDEVNLFSYIYILIILLISLKKSKLKSIEIDFKEIKLFVLTTIFFIGFNFNNKEIFLRYSFYLYFIFPFIIAYLYSFFPFKKDRFPIPIFFCSLLILFLLTLNKGTWYYKDYDNLLFLFL